MVGSWAGWATANDGRHLALMQCCIGNAGRSMYYVWDSIVTREGEGARVNLLLNRASRWVDVDSHLPYEGRVTLQVKEAERIAVRIPEWSERGEVRCKVNDREQAFSWSGSYMEVEGLEEGDRMEVEFPIRERSVYKEIGESPYEMTIKGNTVVGIDPPGSIYPLYEREHYRQGKAPLKTVSRFVSRDAILW